MHRVAARRLLLLAGGWRRELHAGPTALQGSTLGLLMGQRPRRDAGQQPPAYPLGTRPASDGRERLGGALLVGAVALFLAFVLPQLSRPLLYDDASFAFAARAVAETGRPFGNQGWMGERGDYSQREQWALWHPPLYVYLEGLAAKLFGPSPAALRLLGVLAGVATAGLTFLLAAEITTGRRAEKRLAGGIAAALALLSPLVVQSALLVDIDFPLLLPGTLAFLLLYLRLEGGRRWPWLAALVGLLLWAKMTNPLLLVAGIGAWQLLRARPTRSILHPLVIGGGGAALFGATWWGVGTWLGFPLDMPFGVNLVQWDDSSVVARRAYVSLDAFLGGLRHTLLWIGPPLVALGLLATTARAAQLAGGWRVRKVDLLLGLVALLAVGYVNKSAGWFPKYQVALVPLLAAVAAPLVVAPAKELRAAALPAVAVALAAMLVVLRAVRDEWAMSRTWLIEEPVGWWLAGVCLLGLGLSVAGRARADRALPAMLAALAIGWSLGTLWIVARAPYGTTYWYGTTGTEAAAAWADANVLPTETYVAAKEVAYRAGPQRYVDQDTLIATLASDRPFDGTWESQPVQTIVAWIRDPHVADLLARALPPLGYVERVRFGDYVVYQRPDDR